MRFFSILLISFFIQSSAVLGQTLSSASEYAQRGIARFEKNDLEGAIADFTKVIELNGTDQAFCYYFRGIAYYRKGNPTQAIADLSKAIAIKADPRFLDDRGNLLARQGELDRALADLTKAIEIAPQYAKAYGDRALVRLMRGETGDAELDFKKCFEIDKALESQFRAAANQLKHRAALSSLHDKPADVEILKFSWTEAPATILVAPSSGSTTVTTTHVSATGTRVLANPSEKGESGPANVVDASGASMPAPRSVTRNTREVLDYKFTVSMKNIGSKTIVAVKWVYVFEPKDAAHDGLVYVFATRTNISPGKEKTLNDSLPSAGDPKAPIKVPGKTNQSPFNERVYILRLDYADGSSWQSGTDVGLPQKN